MLGVIGTLPVDDPTLVIGEASFQGSNLVVDGRVIDVARGTPALLAAAAVTARALGKHPPMAWLVGDIGQGGGSRVLYAHLCDHLPGCGCSALTFHYLQPDVDWHNKVLFAVQDMNPMPLLMADAGFMYAAKMSGQAGEYDLFTPDAGELAFLADETAPHPFYARGFLLQEDNKAPDLIARAYKHDNAARNLLVKGATDLIVRSGEILHTVSSPALEAMEAMGGTGDSLTGTASALAEAGWDMPEACLLAARANRLAGELAGLTPASQVADLIARIPQALDALLEDRQQAAP